MASLKLLAQLVAALCFVFSCARVDALKIGIQVTNTSIQVVSKECSRKCESQFCAVPPFLRYGKYCGLLYSGCPGEKPCDGLDTCCMLHDACVQAKGNDYLSQQCSQKLVDCMAEFRNSGRQTFKGNTCEVDEVIQVLDVVMEAAIVAGRIFHRP